MGGIVQYLRQSNLVVSKLALSGVAASLIKGTTIHNFFSLDIDGITSLEKVLLYFMSIELVKDRAKCHACFL